MSISVIIPVFNTGEYLEKCVSSVLMQTYSDLEIIMIDDGSTDGSVEIMQKLAVSDSRIQIVLNGHHGVSATRNRGLALARGEYVSFIDSDDWIEPDMYERLLSIAREQDADAVYCSWILEYSDGSSEIPKTNNYEQCYRDEAVLRAYLQKGVGACVSSSIIRRNTIQDARFPLEMERGEDMLFGFRVICHAKCVVDTDIPLYHRYYRLGSLTNRKGFREADFGRALCTDHIVDYVQANKPEYLEYACNRSFNFYMIVLNRMLYYRAEAEYEQIYRKLVSRLDCLYYMLDNPRKLKKQLRYAYILFRYCKEGYRVIDRIYYRYIKKELDGKRQR